MNRRAFLLGCTALTAATAAKACLPPVEDGLYESETTRFLMQRLAKGAPRGFFHSYGQCDRCGGTFPYRKLTCWVQRVSQNGLLTCPECTPLESSWRQTKAYAASKDPEREFKHEMIILGSRTHDQDLPGQILEDDPTVWVHLNIPMERP